MIRLLELPQGEAGRIIASRQTELLPQLLSMLGFDDRVGALRDERLRLQEARERRDEARREVLAERRRAAGLEESWREWQEWQARSAELAHAEAGLRGALRRALHDSDGGGDDDDALRARLAVIDAELLHAAAAPPALAQAAAIAQGRRGVRIVAQHLDPDSPAAQRAITGFLGPRLATLVCSSARAADALINAVRTDGGVVPVAHVSAAGLPAASGLRAQARATDPLVDAYLHALGMDEYEVADAGARGPWEWMPDGPNVVAGNIDADALTEERLEILADLKPIERTRRASDAARSGLQHELDALGDGEERDEDDVARWRAERDAAQRALERLPDPAHLQDQARRLEAAHKRIAAAEQILGEHDDLVERLLDALAQAEDIWREEVAGLLALLGARFSELAEAAGMEGELASSRDGAGDWRIDLLVAEHPGRPRKSYFRDGDLSGGWKAKVGLILMLAALTGGDSRFPVVILDEHAAALDEDRIAEIGAVMQQLSAADGLQFCLGLPTRRSHEWLPWATQQIGFLAPSAGESYAPPPLLISAE